MSKLTLICHSRVCFDLGSPGDLFLLGSYYKHMNKYRLLESA
uniref:Uncharacterized protein n=1 Tax=Arundo donax TaxID=35708 RepID=A0A0A9GK70_ARUDO